MDIIRLDNAGEIVLTTGGFLDDGTSPPRGDIIVRDDSLPCDKGDECSCINRQKVCTSHATCNNFCDSSRMSFYRSTCDQCDCPCPGRTDYPVCWAFALSGISVVGRVKRGGAGGYSLLTSSAGVPTITECSSESTFPVSWDHYDDDDNYLGSSTGSVRVSVSAVFEQYQNTVDQWDGSTIPPYVYATWKADLSLGEGWGVAEDFVASGGYFVRNENGVVGTDFVKVPACKGGTINGTTDPLVTDPNDPNPGNGFPSNGESGGTMVITPKCRQCDGSPCPQSSEPASTCSSATLTMDVYQGMVQEDDDHGNPVFDGDGNPVMVPLYVPFSGTFSGCGGSASSNGMTATISLVLGCTPIADYWPPDAEGAGEGGTLHFEPTWAGFLTTPIGNVDFGQAESDCPVFGGGSFSTTITGVGSNDIIKNFNFTYGTSC